MALLPRSHEWCLCLTRGLTHSSIFWRVNTPLTTSQFRGSIPRIGQTWRGWISVLVHQRQANCASLGALVLINLNISACIHETHPRREARDVWCLPPVWNLRAVIWFHFAISSLVLLPSPVTLSVLSFSACWPFLLNFFQKILQYFSLRDRLFCMARV